MNRSWRTRQTLAAIMMINSLAIVLIAGPAIAQDLDFATVPPRPALGAQSAADALVERLIDEVERIGNEPMDANTDDLQHACRQAMLDVREAARALIDGTAGAASDDQPVLFGMKLAAHREQIDELLRACAALPTDDERRDAIAEELEALHVYTLTAGSHSLTLTVDQRVQQLAAPLASVVEHMRSDRCESHWPAASSVTHPTGLFNHHNDSFTSRSVTHANFVILRDRVAESTALREATRHELLAAHAAVARGSRPDQRAQQHRFARQVDRILSFAERLSAADWLTDEDRALYRNRLHAAVVLSQDADARGAGDAALRRLDMTTQILARGNTLHESRFKLSDVRTLLLAIDEELDDPGSDLSGARRLASGLVVLDQLIDYRRLADVKTLPMPMRRLYLRLTKEYERGERAMLRELQTLARTPHAPADPGFVSLIAMQQTFLESLKRLQNLPEWREKMLFLAPADGGAIDARAISLCERLLDPNERPDAARLAQSFDEQLELFFRLPFEDEMRRADASAREATNNRHLEVMDVLDAARAQWAKSWATKGDGGEYATHMLLLSRLMQAIADYDAIRNADVLNRWPAWQFSESAITATQRRFRQLLQQAANEARRARWERLESRLAQIEREAAPAQLAGRLVRVLGPSLQSLPENVVSLASQCVFPPDEDAWLLDRREDLARFCRYAIEYEHARETDDDELTGEIGAYLLALARNIMMDLGERKDGW